MLPLFPVFANLYGQNPEDFNLENGTSAPCPTADRYSLQRPDGPGVPTQVHVGFLVEDISEIREAEQTVTADVFLLFRWNDPRLADPARLKAQALCNLPVESAWTPPVQIRNIRNLEKYYKDIALIDADGHVIYIQRLLLTVFTRLDLRDFPFDSQKLTFVLDPLLDENELHLNAWEQLVARSDVLSVSSWTLGDPKGKVVSEPARVREASFSVFHCEIPAQRLPGFYSRKLIIPLALIVLMAWAVFWIKPDQTAPQMGVGTTAMLTLIAYHFALGSYLPEIDYLTRADFFLLWSLILVFAALMEAVATAALINYGREATVRKMDRAFRVGYPLAFLLIVVLTIW
jgi:hypothetical protein